MRTAFRHLITVILLTSSQTAMAAEVPRAAYSAPPATVSSGSVLQIIFSLLLVLAAIVLVAWLLKRMNVAQNSNGNLLKVLGGVAVGQRERVVLVEIEDTWLVVGVGPGQIRTLHTLPKSNLPTEHNPGVQQEVSFNTWLKRFVEKRNAT